VPYDIGDVVPLSVQVRDSNGALANATTVVCTVTLPDGTTATPDVTNVSTGVYDAPYTPTMLGRYLHLWASTGTNKAALPEAFLVNGLAGLCSLQDFKEYLNVTSTANDEELRRFLLSASDLAERVTGRALRRTAYSETYDGGRRAILLRHAPVLSVASVSVNGTATTDYTLDTDGILYAGGTSSTSSAWSWGTQNVAVTYTAGEQVPPPAAVDLVLELGRHMWRTQRGAMPSAMGSGDDYVPGAAYALTYRARELADALRLPGLA
jgi:uncharacterized phiE125 gp8 family phage protein